MSDLTNAPPVVAGEPAADRLMRSLDYRLSPPGTPRLSRAQVAVVLHALADHTAITQALQHRRDETPWPEATSMGRWLHDTADDLERTGDRYTPLSSGTKGDYTYLCADCGIQVANRYAHDREKHS